MGASAGPDIIDDGLVLALDAADRNSYPGSGTTWYDLSGNGYNASLSNVTYSSSNRTLQFNGSTSTAFVSSFTPPRSAHTIIIWAKSSVALADTLIATDRKTIFKNGSQWNPGLWMTGRRIRPHIPPEYRDKFITYNPFTNWFSVGQVWDGNDVYTILDSSVTLDTLQSSSYVQSSVDGMSIGYESGTTAYTWNGEIALFQIYNKALTASEIQQNFNALRGRFGI